MDAFEDQIILTPKENETAADSSPKSDPPELKALLAVKKFTAQLEEEYNELLKIEIELNELQKDGLLIIEATTSPAATAQWNAILQEMNKAINSINGILTTAKENAAQKKRKTILWIYGNH